ncbi:MAG TPA: TonB-dependent receptor plug domain-containing protein [Rhodoferax sp.]|nr:TonB-dependent receptor plug domain-containing protein [Rhodoferax sp.]
MDLINIPVVTASRQLETLDRMSSCILVFTRAQVREHRYRNPTDLRQDLPDFDFKRGTRSSACRHFTVQGLVGPNKLLMDGAHIGNPAGGSLPVAENIALHPAKQVELLFGLAAAVCGADALAWGSTSSPARRTVPAQTGRHPAVARVACRVSRVARRLPA